MKDKIRQFLTDVAGDDVASALEAVLDAADTGLLVTNPEDVVVLANAAACGLLGLPYKDVVGRPLGLVLGSRRADHGVGLGSEASPIRSSSGAVVGHLNRLGRRIDDSALEPDETLALRARVGQLEQENEALRLSEATRTDLLSTVSHELRTPLVTIIGYVEMIGQFALGDVPVEVAKSLKVVLRNALKLSSSIDDLLNLSRLQGEDIIPHKEVVPLSVIVNSVLPEQNMMLEDKRIRIDVDLPGELSSAHCDRRLVGIALENLLKNAVKFSPPESVVRLTAEEDGGVLRVMVTDSGPGIPPEKLEQVFEPFYQVDSSYTRAHGGIGLGLSIVKKIVEAHGGRAFLRSKENEGTTATIEIPSASVKAAKRSV